MRAVAIFFTMLLLATIVSCSIAPEKQVSRRELYKTNLFNEFSIKESPESVLATLNRDGEVVLEGKHKLGDEYFIKILATDTGLKVRFYPK